MQEASQRMVESSHTSSKKTTVALIFLSCAIVLVIVAILVGRIFLSPDRSNATSVGNEKKEVTDLVKKVSMLMELPKEEPTIATVADKTKLKDQAFFAQAENGDKVLIFTNAKKAILYRPFTNKIIEVTTLNVTRSSDTPALSPTKTVEMSPTSMSEE